MSIYLTIGVEWSWSFLAMTDLRNPPGLYKWVRAHWLSDSDLILRVGCSYKVKWFLVDMWTEVVIYLFFDHIYILLKFLIEAEAGLSFPLPHLIPFLLAYGKPDWNPCVAHPSAPQHGVLRPLPAELYFIGKHRCLWNEASVCKSWLPAYNSEKPSARRKWATVTAGGICNGLWLI